MIMWLISTTRMPCRGSLITFIIRKRSTDVDANHSRTAPTHRLRYRTVVRNQGLTDWSPSARKRRYPAAIAGARRR